MNFYFPSNPSSSEVRDFILYNEDLRFPIVYKNGQPLIQEKSLTCPYEKATTLYKILLCTPHLEGYEDPSLTLVLVPYDKVKDLGADILIFGPDLSKNSQVFIR